VERAGFTLSDTVHFLNVHAGMSKDSFLIFRNTGTVYDTVSVVNRIAGLTWMSYVDPLPRLVVLTPPFDTAHLQVHTDAPRDTEHFQRSSACLSSRVFSTPCSRSEHMS